MNLIQESPRSPREKLADLVHLPRMIDKARADQQKTLGEYIYPCPLDQIMLEFLGVDSDTFQKKACNDTEETLSAWVASQCQNRSLGDKDTINNKILKSQPDSLEKWETFHEIRNRLDPSRTDLTTWVDLIDLEEGRL
ncbi:MAG: DUF5069 domain-containing protein [Nitrospinaceae bacterium]